jgi:hypothetical protein
MRPEIMTKHIEHLTPTERLKQAHEDREQLQAVLLTCVMHGFDVRTLMALERAVDRLRGDIDQLCGQLAVKELS